MTTVGYNGSGKTSAPQGLQADIMPEVAPMSSSDENGYGDCMRERKPDSARYTQEDEQDMEIAKRAFGDTEAPPLTELTAGTVLRNRRNRR
ncbi:hypothetical protein R1flu_001462 [Riccia fluitans]|uniref:Uncharacterized protein n=1 Tax=Riccia fluitans TaxID=41844 RepID=A0ABD1Y6N2_9MARC